jgi:hypothetical protein
MHILLVNQVRFLSIWTPYCLGHCRKSNLTMSETILVLNRLVLLNFQLPSTSVGVEVLHEDERREQRQLRLRQRASLFHRRRKVRMPGQMLKISLFSLNHLYFNFICTRAYDHPKLLIWSCKAFPRQTQFPHLMF